MSSRFDGIQSETTSESEARVCLDSSFYSREAVLRACYWYTDVAYIQVPESDPGKLTVSIKLKHQTPSLDNPKPTNLEQLVGEFCNSVLDFELRRQIEKETAPVRQLILAKAFSESGVLEDSPPGSVEDPVEKNSPGSLIGITKNIGD